MGEGGTMHDQVLAYLLQSQLNGNEEFLHLNSNPGIRGGTNMIVPTRHCLVGG